MKWHKSKIDLKQLELEISEMSPRSKLYKSLQKSLMKVDHWKAKARWHPKKGGPNQFGRKK